VTLTPPPNDLPAIIRQLRLQIEESNRRHLGGVPVVGALSDVTNPITGQLVILSADNIVYRWDGAAWKAATALGGNAAATRQSARYRQTTAQNINNAADTPLQFQTCDRPSNNVVASGTGNTTFTLQKSGDWTIATGCRYLGNSGGGERSLYISTDPITTLSNRLLQNSAFPGPSPGTVSVSLTDYFTAGTAIDIGAYQSCGATLGMDLGIPNITRVTFTYHGQEE
jgi:hypothetical protein